MAWAGSMYIIRGLINLPEGFRGSAVTIGNFDGVHRGHQALFATLRPLAARHHAPALALTFEPHPRRLLMPGQAPARITGVRAKARWMADHGLDGMFVLQFTHALAALPPETFVENILVRGLGAREVLVGDHFRFGAGGRGNFDTLHALGEAHGFGVHQEPSFILDGERVSSTAVRRAVQSGDFAHAEALLGRPFELEARVQGGQQRGRGMGFPTANLPVGENLHPPPGVYVVAARVDGGWLPGVANLGINPTFGDEGFHLEVHLLVPCPDLYRRVMRVRFLHHLRPETRFPDVSALRQQIARDVEAAQAFFARNGA